MRNLSRLLRNPTSISIYINTFGNYLNVAFTAIITLVLFRIMSPEPYGVYSVLISVTYVMAQILEFGTSATIYSYLPPMIAEKQGSIFKFVKSTFYYQTVFAGIVVIALLFSFPFIDTFILKTRASFLEMSLATISILFFIWQNFILNLYFAAKKFLQANIYMTVSNVIKGLAIFVAYLTGTVNVASLIFILGIVGTAVFIGLALYERREVLANVLEAEVDKGEFRFKYAITYFIASQFLNVGLRMDLFILSYFNLIITRPEIGLYAAAQKVVLTVLTTIISITQVLSPGFTSLTTRRETRKQMKHGLLYMLIPIALFVGVALTPEIIYEWFFTKAFSSAALLARLLSLPYIFYAIGSLPMLFLLYTVKRPKPILIAYATFFVIVTVGCAILVPVFKLFAPPAVFALAFLISNVIIAWQAWREYQRLPK